MKSDLEIQRAHDLLRGLAQIKGALPSTFAVAADVLCWVLGHQNEFAHSLAEVETIMHAMGVEIVDSGRLNYPNGEGPVH